MKFIGMQSWMLKTDVLQEVIEVSRYAIYVTVKINLKCIIKEER